jgi:CheY-like chemotaxis protein
MTSPAPSALASRRILIVEDEYFLADDMARALHKIGAQVVGPVGELNDALELLAREDVVDAAVVDVNLRSQMAFPITGELRSRGIPFIFVSGYDRSTLPDEYGDTVLLAKPIDPPAIINALGRVLDRKAGDVSRDRPGH